MIECQLQYLKFAGEFSCGDLGLKNLGFYCGT